MNRKQKARFIFDQYHKELVEEEDNRVKKLREAKAVWSFFSIQFDSFCTIVYRTILQWM